MNHSGISVWRALVAVAMALPAPQAWAALDVADPAEVTREVSEQVERLVQEVTVRDPELAQEIERQGTECLRDISDGRLDNTEIVRDVESYRDVQRELTERVLTTEMARVNPEAAERMQAAFESWQGVGTDGAGRGTEFAGPSAVGMQEARGHMEQAYQEAVSRGDAAGAEMMKSTFESMERGEAVRPTPEMMEKMHQEMERFVAERPEMAEFARVEWDRMTDQGMDRGERSGAMETPEQQREGFERWASESGKSADEITRMRETMEKGFEHMGASREEMERGFANGSHDMEHLREMGEAGRAEAREGFERWAESPEARNVDRETVERYREMAERSFEGRSEADREAVAHEREAREWERDTSIILDNRIVEPPSGGGNTEPHTLVRDLDGPNSEWSGPNGVHEHADGAPPH